MVSLQQTQTVVLSSAGLQILPSFRLVRSLGILNFIYWFTLWNSFQIPQGEFVFWNLIFGISNPVNCFGFVIRNRSKTLLFNILSLAGLQILPSLWKEMNKK